MKRQTVIFMVLTLIAAFVTDIFIRGQFSDSIGWFESRQDGYDYYPVQEEDRSLTAILRSAEERYTPAELMNAVGDECEIAGTAFEFSNKAPAGYITKINMLSETPGESGKIPLEITLCKGGIGESDERCDFKNLIDPEDWFDGSERDYNDVDEHTTPSYTVSYNEYYTARGDKAAVRIYSYTCGTGKQFMSVRVGSHSRVHPCAYDSSETSALSYSYEDHFSLLLEDYNADGTPDFCYRIGDVGGGKSAYYGMYLTDPEGRAQGRRHRGVDGIADEGFLVYGETADSIRLGVVNRDTYFFLSEYEGEVVPAFFDMASGDMLSEDETKKFFDHGAVFTSRYEDGIIYLKATEVTGNVFEGRAELSLKKLDDMVWEDVPLGERYGDFYAECFGSDCEEIPVTLPRGLYRLTADIDGVKTSTEFYSR